MSVQTADIYEMPPLNLFITSIVHSTDLEWSCKNVSWLKKRLGGDRLPLTLWMFTLPLIQ